MARHGSDATAGDDDDVDRASRSTEVDPGKGGPEPQRRYSLVREIANKFEKGQASGGKVVVVGASEILESADESQFQKLRRILKALRERVAGRNKADVEEALKVVEALETLQAQKEIEFVQARAEVKTLGGRLKQVSDDAKSMVEETRSSAQAEIEDAKETATKLGSALREAQNESEWSADEKREFEELKREAQEVRRIKALHGSSRAMEMEREIVLLRQQLSEKSAETTKLRKGLALFKDHARDPGRNPWYQINGDLQLGTTLSIGPVDGDVLDLSHCTIQWYQIIDGKDPDIISGAIRPQYAPEPDDVGKILKTEISLPNGKTQSVQTLRPIEPSRGLDKYVETLVSKCSAQFNVRIVLRNGETVLKQSLHTFDVNKVRIKLHKKNNLTVKAKEAYSPAMQLCGARGGGDSAAQGLFWVARKGTTFMLVMESERERNAALLLAREFARLQKVRLGGSGESTLSEP